MAKTPVEVKADTDDAQVSGLQATSDTDDAALLAQAPAGQAEQDQGEEVVLPIRPTPAEIAIAASIRAASTTEPTAPAAPDTSQADYVAPVPFSVADADANVGTTEDHVEDKPDDGIHPESGLDGRLHMALDLAKRGLAFASINDLAKAVLLMLDMHCIPEPHASPVAVAAARGEAPSLL